MSSPNLHQSLCFHYAGHRAQKQRIDDAEDRGVCANAERQGQYSNQREAGILEQHSQAIPQILKERIDDSESTHLAIHLLQQCHVSELAARGPSGLDLGHPLADISLGEQAQMRLDLVVELSIRLTISEQSSKSRYQGAQIVGHFYSWPSSLGTRPITPEIRSQFSVSSASCFRPLFVIE